MSSGSNSQSPDAVPSNPDFDLDAFQVAFEKQACELGFKPQTLTTIQGDPIIFWSRRSKDLDALTIFLSAGMHGDEPSAPWAALDFLKQGGANPAYNWIIAPVLNPSGLRLGTRENAQGIDLNRDFLQKQSPECQAVTAWWDAFEGSIDLHLSLHEDWEATGFYFYAINTGPLACRSAQIQEKLAEQLPLECSELVDDHELEKPGLIVHECVADDPEGWPEAIYLCKKYPLLSYTFEAPGSLSVPQRAKGLLFALNTVMDKLS